MSNYFNPQIQRVARKQQQCEGCLHSIPKSDTYIEQSGFYDGKPFRNKFHPECVEILNESTDGGSYEFIPGECEPPDRIKHSSTGEN